MKVFVEVIQEEDPCLIRLLPKDIGGQTCKKRRRSMSRNAFNVRGLRPIFTSLEGFSTLFLAVAFCSMGPGHCGTFPQGSGK